LAGFREVRNKVVPGILKVEPSNQHLQTDDNVSIGGQSGFGTVSETLFAITALLYSYFSTATLV